MLGFRRIALFWGLLIFPWAAAYPQSARLMEFTDWDRRFNIPKYRATIDPRPIGDAWDGIDYWDVSVDQLRAAGLFHLTDISPGYEMNRTGDHAVYAPELRHHIRRLYSSRRLYPGIHEYFRSAFGEPQGDLPSLRMSGHSSHLIVLESGVFVIKMTTFGDGQELNAPHFLHRGRVLSELPQRDEAELGIRLHFPEFGLSKIVQPSQNRYVQGVMFRDIETPLAELSANQSAYPLHAFLSPESGLVQKQAEIMGMAPADWILYEYLPKLAQHLAFLHFQLGFLHQSHTQNLVLIANSETGQVDHFLLRDMQDADYFELVRAWQKREPVMLDAAQSFEFSSLFSRRQPVVDGVAVWRPGAIIAEFAGQAAAFFANSQVWEPALAQQFLEEYRRAAQRELGVPIQRGKSAQTALAQLSTMMTSAHSGFDRRELVAIMETEVDDLFAGFVRQYFSESHRSSDFSSDQATLRVIYEGLQKEYLPGQLPYFTEFPNEVLNSPENLKLVYAFNGRVLYRVCLQTGEVLDYFHLDAEGQEYTRELLRLVRRQNARLDRIPEELLPHDPFWRQVIAQNLKFSIPHLGHLQLAIQARRPSDFFYDATAGGLRAAKPGPLLIQLSNAETCATGLLVTLQQLSKKKGDSL